MGSEGGRQPEHYGEKAKSSIPLLRRHFLRLRNRMAGTSLWKRLAASCRFPAPYRSLMHN
jgi:hypothetical protein